jgi:hypothetical protein
MIVLVLATGVYVREYASGQPGGLLVLTLDARVDATSIDTKSDWSAMKDINPTFLIVVVVVSFLAYFYVTRTTEDSIDAEYEAFLEKEAERAEEWRNNP